MVKCLILDLRSGLDPGVVNSSPTLGSTQGRELLKIFKNYIPNKHIKRYSTS